MGERKARKKMMSLRMDTALVDKAKEVAAANGVSFAFIVQVSMQKFLEGDREIILKGETS